MAWHNPVVHYHPDLGLLANGVPIAPVSGAGTLKNFSPKSYPKTRRAMGRQAANGESFGVLCIGDSTTEGFDGVSLVNCVSRSWVRRLADTLTARGIKAGWQNVLGDHRTDAQGSSIQTADSRVTALPAGWGLGTMFGLAPGAGGNNFANATNTNPLTFSPTVQTDTADLFYYNVAGYDSINIRSGAAGATAPTTGGTVAITGTNRLAKATATYTLGANVWTAAKATANGNPLIMAGLSCYNSTLPEISLYNLGCGSMATSYFTATTNFWDTLASMTLAGGGLVCPTAIIMLGINDAIAGATQAAMTTALSTVVAALQAAGTEVLLVVPPPSVAAAVPQVNQDRINAAYEAVAVTYGCALISLPSRWVSGDAANANGYIGDSTVHPSPFGYGDIGAAVSGFFLSL